MFEKAIELDPGYADAYGVLGFSYLVGYLWLWDRDPGVLDRAAGLAKKSIALDDSEAVAYAILGWVAALHGQHDQAITDAERAVSLDPNSAFCWATIADIYNILVWKPEEALAYAQKAIRLD